MTHTKQNVTLITGAATGLGRATAETLAQQDHIVYASMRDPSGRHAAHAKELTALGDNVHVIELDVTNDASTTSAVNQIIAEQGRIDVLINNAGNGYFGLMESLSITELQTQMDVNFFAVARMNLAVLPYMRKQKSGLLIHISSVVGRVIVPFFGIYNASKFAVEALAETYRYELSSHGVDSILIEPGPFATAFMDNSLRPADTAGLSSYGALLDAPDQMANGFNEMMQNDENCNPKIVADDIAKLIDTPYGQRPLRTTSGTDFGVSGLNDAVAPFQRGVLEGMEMLAMDPNAVVNAPVTEVAEPVM